MILEQKTEYIRFHRQDITFTFLPEGDIFEFTAGSVLINQFLGNPVDGSANNIYLRIYDEGQTKEGSAAGEDMQSLKPQIKTVIPLLGRASKSRLTYKKDYALYYQGTEEGIDYKVTFLPADHGVWFWKVELEGQNVTCDLIYGQDISVADKGGVLSNELYISQYLDHHIELGEHGTVVCSRQNQSQGGRFPYLQQGALTSKVIRFSTDGMQFFGKTYKKTGIPEALVQNLADSNYQYELSYTALQTEQLNLQGKETILFYGCFRPDHKSAVTKLEYQEEILSAWQQVLQKETEETEVTLGAPLHPEFGSLYSSECFQEEEKINYFPERNLEETQDGKLLSCFTKDHRHIVFQEKELLVERPHGNIVTTLIDPNTFEKPLITSTHYMYGFFNGQITVGNTNMNKMISVNRGLLNVQKNTGQRIYIRLDGKFRLLALPAAFELGLNYSRWFYKIEEDILTITSFAGAEQAELVLDVVSKQGKTYDFLITNQLVMGEHEFTAPCILEQEGSSVLLTLGKGSAASAAYPNLNYRITLSEASAQFSDDRIFYADKTTRNGTLLTIQTTAEKFRLTIRGSLEQQTKAEASELEMEAEYQKYVTFYQNFLCGLQLHLENGDEGQKEIERLSPMLYWYVHNALVHFAVPHGLEQSGGAAWGTRDVCQGPMELFLATGHTALAREVIWKLFAHQNRNGEWPQWFMFDRYPYYAGDCHGDVVFWPLKAIGDYIEVSGDNTILEEQADYLDGSKETVLEHIKRAYSAIKERYLFDTALISYAGGDWDDTLQPADPAMKEKLVSAWTQALAYQTLKGLGQQLTAAEQTEFGEELTKAAEKIGTAFRQYLCKDGVIAGFAYFDAPEKIRYLLHPEDHETGIHYRLLPLTRSIICGLADPVQKDQNIKLIEEKLACPDGVRLMDHPARYEGGVSRYFMRAEQASNVGREISLQYVHAHIRYIQAMAVAGEAEKAWDGLLTILPAGLRQTVSNADYRQSNAYFSSSEGAFSDRYDYQERFELLREGTIGVKGGWRIYSSGPGIYLARVITDLLGIRRKAQMLGFDPILPKHLSGLQVSFQMDGIKVNVNYLDGKQPGKAIRVMAGEEELPGKRMENPYRPGGIWLEKEVICRLSAEGTKTAELTVIY